MTESRDEDAFENILRYTAIVGQESLKLALELAFVEPRIGGVLISGQRGTCKSTAVRAFARMVQGKLPVTLPINATEDRVVGGWRIDKLMAGIPEPQPGLLMEANGSILYIDEVNLLDDHLVNMILDVVSTGVLEIQREAQNQREHVSFSLVGTMNPEEGGLRPQLLDRFGLMVDIRATKAEEERIAILKTVLALDEALVSRGPGQPGPVLDKWRENDGLRKAALVKAKTTLEEAKQSEMVPDTILKACVAVSEKVDVEGHRGELTLALAARALAALRGSPSVETGHVRDVAPLALQHRRKGSSQGERAPWGPADDKLVEEALARA